MLLSQPPPRREETLPDGRHGHFQKRADVFLRVLAHVEERRRDALAFGERPDGGEHLRAQLARLGGVVRAGFGRGDSRAGFERQEREALAPRHAVALCEHDAAEPAGERRWLAQLAELLPRRDEGLLRRVFGEVRVAEHGVGAAVGHVLKSRHQFAERLAPLGVCGVRGGDAVDQCAGVPQVGICCLYR